MIYRRDDGQLSCKEHPLARFGREPLGDNATSRRAREHLVRDHPDIARVLALSTLEPHRGN